ncbi:Ribosomal protein lysine methyltransferase [Microbotryomycetes sp. JL201]|nr:Ribosomal protein lysine methyltransferase [Microbotryomycetes sp. JL201]
MSDSIGGLGFISDKSEVLHVSIDVTDVYSQNGDSSTSQGVVKGKAARARAQSSSVATTVEIELLQNLEALRHRKGDTGSVFWRMSYLFAQYMLACALFPSCADRAILTRTEKLDVLELGSGTGGLGILLASYFKHWTFTDQYVNLNLIDRNLRHNGLCDVEVQRSKSSSKASKLVLPKSPPLKDKQKLSPTGVAKPLKPSTSIRELDWQQASNPVVRGLVKPVNGPENNYKSDEKGPDVILAVDCLYNPNLSSCLAHTIDLQAGRDSVVLVVSELRDSEPLENFLETWLGIPRGDGQQGRGWNVVRVVFDKEWVNGIGGNQFVVWVGWRAG